MRQREDFRVPGGSAERRCDRLEQHTGTLPAPTLAFINANVQRFVGTPAGPNSLEHNYTPTGDLRIPALTLSTFRDPVIPGFHRAIYGQEVAANGGADWLVQHRVRLEPPNAAVREIEPCTTLISECIDCSILHGV